MGSFFVLDKGSYKGYTHHIEEVGALNEFGSQRMLAPVDLEIQCEGLHTHTHTDVVCTLVIDAQSWLFSSLVLKTDTLNAN